MASPSQQLPPGWTAEWDPASQRYLFIQPSTGRSQWEIPTAAPAQMIDHAPSVSPPPSATHHGKRRQYAAGQTQVYYGAGDALGDQYGGLNVQQQQPAPTAQLFTPGLAAEGGFAGQQQVPQASYYAPQQEPQYINAPGFGQEPTYHPPNAPIHHLTDQFGQMGMGPKPLHLTTTNLLTSPPDPRELVRPPPEIRLPANACITPSPYANADPSYQRCTMNAIPTTSSMLNKSKIPLGLVITPYRTVKEGEPPVPVVTDTVIARCRRCRTYINPYVQFIDNGNRWRCCMCSMSNEVPQLFDWDQIRNQPGDRWARDELNHSVVEFVAPTEYMVRPPQPAVYVILIDVSHTAVQSGMVATATRTILENLDRIPNEDERTKVAIIAYDISLYFFSMPPGTTESTMLVVSDVDDVFLPKPTDLLINLTEARQSLELLLGRINDMFQDNHTVGSAMGPALQAGFKLMAPIGGKIMVLSSSLPNIGAGSLKNREDLKILGTSKESGLLQAASPFYKTFAIECSRAQVSVDMFLFSAAYQDVASLACLPHYTSGQTYFYPAFNAARSEDAIKFAHEFGEVLAMPIMLEAVMRVRASKGLRMASFHGNFFVRSTDLLAMPAVPTDQSYAIEIQIEDTLTQPFVVMQTAVLHTTCHGERRIRVITLALPTTSSLTEVFASADQVAIATLLANKAVERSLTHKLEDARDAVHQRLVDILSSYKSSMTSAGAGANAQLAISENLRMLPVLVLGLLKNVGIRQSAQIPPDLRAYAQALLTTLPSQTLIPYIHPTFFSLHNMPPEAGTVGEQGVILPTPLPLTSERLERHGLYLIEDGQTIFLWIGRDAVPQLVMDVFNLPNYEVLRGGKTTLPVLDNDFSQRVNAIIQKTREMRRGVYYPHLYLVKEDGEPPLRLWALSCLIQDRADVLPSYQQFIGQLKDKVNGANNY
ncbi:Sec23/Sec24 trunk domain-containing protein [Suillus clintonianus]|uniref:Sec23/Sec24 trunk domain-containing protein n=1 Tax=Suillus clintonianus TaxID=1904413 RepID=UPI001B8697CF|nr:Sec23/Sec24 trunk domain-containing protein [Suillus clintonianus]KAG2124450.1 Sec23/Sec24 trunk domain-containing protein [Suillus clintonianus]